MSRRSISSLALVASLTCFSLSPSPTRAAAAGVWIGGGDTAVAFGNAALNPGEPDGLPFRTDPASLTANYQSQGGGSQLLDVNGTLVNFTSNAFAQATGHATIGTLHATAFAHAQTTPDSVVYDGGVYSSPFWTQPIAKMALGWTDTITIQSSTLPHGTPVQLRGTATLHSSVSSDASLNNTAFAKSTLMIGIQSNGVGRTFKFAPFVDTLVITDRSDTGVHTPPPSRSVDFILNVAVGDLLFPDASLEVYALTSSLAGIGDTTAIADAGNTSFFTLVPLTPGVTYTTQSGVTFVPEPSSLLAACGLAIPFLTRRRRQA